MIISQLVLAFAWTFGANGFLIERQLAETRALPEAPLLEVADHVRIVFHDRRDWAMAFYLPPSGDPGSPEGRLFLHAPYYLAPSGLAAPSRMPVDVAEYYFHALLEASLDLDRAAGSRYATWTRQRASELMADVPEAQRPDSYLGALSDFGAHLLSMRNEVWRLAKRQAAAGRDVCRHLDSPASLFGLWRQSIEQGAYFGSYYLPAGGGVPSQSRRPLTRSDKARFLTEILGVVWAGDPATDFAGLCSSRGSLSSRRLPGAR